MIKRFVHRHEAVMPKGTTMADNIDPTIRPRVDALVAKARSDDAFAFSLRSDPDATLRAEGFADGLLETLTRELGDTEVEGFQRCWRTCDWLTCILTYCSYYTD
jgi:transposase